MRILFPTPPFVMDLIGINSCSGLLIIFGQVACKMELFHLHLTDNANI